MVTSLLEARFPDSSQNLFSGNAKWGGLSLGTLPLAIASAHVPGKLSLIVTADSTTAEKLAQAVGFFLGKTTDQVLRFPGWETLVYEQLSPHPDIISSRLAILRHLIRGAGGILVIPITTLMQRLPPKSWLVGQSLRFEVGQPMHLNHQRQQLDDAGYARVQNVYTHGEYALRGALIDIFPMGQKHPVRVELLDDTIENLRLFDPESQRTLTDIDAFERLPANEWPLLATEHFKTAWAQHFGERNTNYPLYQDVCKNFAPPGIEYYLPLFFEQTDSLLDYLPEACPIVLLDGIQAAAEQFHADTKDRFDKIKAQGERPILSPHEIHLSKDQVMGRLQTHPCVHIYTRRQKNAPETINFSTADLPKVTFDLHAQQPTEQLAAFINSYNGRILLCAESLGRREVLLEHLHKADIHPRHISTFGEFLDTDAPLAIIVGTLDQGFCLRAPAITVLAEMQLFGARAVQQHRQQSGSKAHRIHPETMIRDLMTLKVGDPVVHLEHGVGRYQGLEKLEIKGDPYEFLKISYAEDSHLYVPITSLYLVSRYAGGAPDEAPLHHLGSNRWQRARDRAVKKARDVAAELLAIHAKRAAGKGYAHASAVADYERFAAQFPFEETEDQTKAIAAVRADMRAPQPMDRLICGDVGFGKTEVAMRAAFISVMHGKQVAVIAPTTLLAEQHLLNFQDRFADWQTHIAGLSRFRSDSEVQKTKARLESGEMDIVIGTHKLLQPTIRFNNLGLVIIDEEHRFGVRQKERLKSLRAQVDVLTLTATPIPRTLNMAVSGLRDLSIIATPPAQRLAIKTLVKPHRTDLIQEAIQRELLRGGQIYYVHNKVTSIERVAADLRQLIPDIEVLVGHGQMPEWQLERVMADFYHRRGHILVCTTIIENGIDVPNANTIIINRADQFGLAQLHQLRGRVGRSHHQAYAYLLIPDGGIATKEAHRRLEAIAMTTELGAGFTLATQDLEIRGAGALLGDEQSGEIQSVGLTLYTKMLEQAVYALQSGQMAVLDDPMNIGFEAEVDLQTTALIPDNYLPDVHERLMMYKRISEAGDKTMLDAMRAELVDRFGALPAAANALLKIAALKNVAKSLCISRVTAGEAGGWIEFAANHAMDPAKLVALVQAKADELSLRQDGRLSFSVPLATLEVRLTYIEQLLQDLAIA